MKRPLVIVLALLFPLAATGQKRRQPNRPPLIDSYTSSSTTLPVCPFHPELFAKPVVDLLVNATDPDGDSLQYEYSTTEGSISGKGKSVTWDLNNVRRGPHEVRVKVTDGKGGTVEAVLTVTTVDAGTCDPPPPPCPVVKVNGFQKTTAP